MIKRLVILYLLGIFTVPISAQDFQIKSMDDILLNGKGDSSVELGLNTFMYMVLANHPVAKQADLLPEQARQEIRMARGAFDPKIESAWNIKDFKDTDYYNIFNATLKIPTWFPIDPKISVDQNRGVFLDPENSIPSTDDFRQISTGVSLPIGRGLFIDQRRADVKQARLFARINDAERIKVINKLLLEAAKEYWNWYFAYYNFRVIESSLEISEEIFDRVKIDFEFGEAAVVDTVQAAITLQNRRIDRTTAFMEFQNAGLILSNFLWGENEEPLELADYHLPAYNDLFDILSNEDPVLDTLLLQAMTQHPELQKLNLKLDQLEVGLKLARENLKPRLNVNYDFINSPLGPDGGLRDLQFGQNYKFGLDFSFPLFLRKERAKVAQSKLKISETSFERDLKELEILNGIEGAYYALDNSKQMLELTDLAVSNYQLLLEAELFNLEVGDSDLFKINFQQDKLLESQVKLLKLKAEVEKAKALLFWSAGIPYLNFEQPQ